MRKPLNLKGFTDCATELPFRPGTYRVLTDKKVFTTAYFDGKKFETEDVIEYWADRKKR